MSLDFNRETHYVALIRGHGTTLTQSSTNCVLNHVRRRHSNRNRIPSNSELKAQKTVPKRTIIQLNAKCGYKIAAYPARMTGMSIIYGHLKDVLNRDRNVTLYSEGQLHPEMFIESLHSPPVPDALRNDGILITKVTRGVLADEPVGVFRANTTLSDIITQCKQRVMADPKRDHRIVDPSILFIVQACRDFGNSHVGLQQDVVLRSKNNAIKGVVARVKRFTDKDQRLNAASKERLLKELANRLAQNNAAPNFRIGKHAFKVHKIVAQPVGNTNRRTYKTSIEVTNANRNHRDQQAAAATARLDKIHTSLTRLKLQSSSSSNNRRGGSLSRTSSSNNTDRNGKK